MRPNPWPTNGTAPGPAFTRRVTVESRRGTVTTAESPVNSAVALVSAGPGAPDTLWVTSSKRAMAPPGPKVAV